MATYRRHGAGWQAQIIRKGYPARYRTFDTKDAAKKWAVQIEAEMTRGAYKDPDDSQQHDVRGRARPLSARDLGS